MMISPITQQTTYAKWILKFEIASTLNNTLTALLRSDVQQTYYRNAAVDSHRKTCRSFFIAFPLKFLVRTLLRYYFFFFVRHIMLL